MMVTARMKHLVAVVLAQDADRITKELLDQGIIEFVKIKELAGAWGSQVRPRSPRVAAGKVGELRKRIETILKAADLSPGDPESLDVSRLTSINYEEIAIAIGQVTTRIQAVRDRQKNLQTEILKVEEIERQMRLFGDVGAAVRARSRYSFLTIQAGEVPVDRFSSLEGAMQKHPSVVLNYAEDEKSVTALIIAMKRDDQAMERILADHAWKRIEFPHEVSGLQQGVLADLSAKLTRMRDEQTRLAGEVRSIVEEKADELRGLWANLRMNELYYTIQSYFSATDHTVLFSGWLPASKQRLLEARISQATGGRCHLEWHSPRQVAGSDGRPLTVPVHLSNPRFLAPFQMLVENYSIPEYGTVDPTPIVAVAFLIMYGMMFGDAGQGLVLLLLGISGAIIFRKRSPTWLKLSNLVIWCGSMGILFGMAFGSYFGMQWIKPLWFDYEGIVSGHTEQLGLVQNLNSILSLTIYFGIAVIGIGLVLNWINLISRRRWFKLILDKTGLVGAWVYGFGVYVAWYYASHSFRELPDLGFMFWTIGVPVILFFFKAPIEFFLHGRREGKRFTVFTVVDFIMEWIVEILEVFSGYLANTLSFLRVAGLGIAHVSLMVAFFQMAKMVGTPSGGNTVWSILVLLLGNVLVIVLEGFTAGVQSLRLNYYEFFSKYFSGTGKAYTPVSLRNREVQEV